MQKGFAPILFLIVLVVIVAAVSGAYYFVKSQTPKSAVQNPPVASQKPKACTEEAKVCPDGSSVGRVGLNCEFSPCPSASPNVSDETANWKTYINSKYGFSIMYPNTWIITEGVSDGIIIFGMGKGSTPNGGFYYGGQSVLVEVASLNLSNLEYIKANIAPTFNPQKIGNVRLGESVGEKWIFNDNDSDNYAIFFNKNGKRYVVIKESSNKSQFNDYHLEIDQVISTFKFLP